MKLLRTINDQYIVLSHINSFFVGRDQKDKAQWKFYMGLATGGVLEFLYISEIEYQPEALCYLEAALKWINSSQEFIIDVLELSNDMWKNPQNYGIPDVRNENGKAKKQ